MNNIDLIFVDDFEIVERREVIEALDFNGDDDSEGALREVAERIKNPGRGLVGGRARVVK